MLPVPRTYFQTARRVDTCERRFQGGLRCLQSSRTSVLTRSAPFESSARYRPIGVAGTIYIHTKLERDTRAKAIASNATLMLPCYLALWSPYHGYPNWLVKLVTHLVRLDKLNKMRSNPVANSFYINFMLCFFLFLFKYYGRNYHIDLPWQIRQPW